MTYLALPTLGTLSLLAIRNDWMDNQDKPAFLKSLATMSLSTVSIVSFDTVARLFKNFLWKFAESKAKDTKEKEVEPTQVTEKLIAFAKKTPRAALLLAAILGVSYPLEQLLVTQTLSPAVLAVIAQEVGTLFKPFLKGFVGTEVGLSVMIPAILSLTLLKFDQNLAMALLADNTLFGLKDMVRPKKIKDQPLNNLEQMETSRFAQLLQSVRTFFCKETERPLLLREVHASADLDNTDDVEAQSLVASG